MAKLPILSVIILGFLASCNPVSGGKTNTYLGTDFNPGILPTSNPPDVQVSAGPVNGFKVTTGAQGMAGTTLGAKATILANNEKLIGTQVSGRFSINKTKLR